MNIIFSIISGFINWLAHLTSLTYYEVFIILYFIFIPFTYLILLDSIWGRDYLKLFYGAVVILFFIFIKDFKGFSDKLYASSEKFLNSFDGIGISYISTFVFLFVFLVFVVYAILIYFVIKKKRGKKSY